MRVQQQRTPTAAAANAGHHARAREGPIARWVASWCRERGIETTWLEGSAAMSDDGSALAGARLHGSGSYPNRRSDPGTRPTRERVAAAALGRVRSLPMGAASGVRRLPPRRRRCRDGHRLRRPGAGRGCRPPARLDRIRARRGARPAQTVRRGVPQLPASGRVAAAAGRLPPHAGAGARRAAGPDRGTGARSAASSSKARARHWATTKGRCRR